MKWRCINMSFNVNLASHWNISSWIWTNRTETKQERGRKSGGTLHQKMEEWFLLVNQNNILKKYIHRPWKHWFLRFVMPYFLKLYIWKVSFEIKVKSCGPKCTYYIEGIWLYNFIPNVVIYSYFLYCYIFIMAFSNS